jgi:hypothetical protein
LYKTAIGNDDTLSNFSPDMVLYNSMLIAEDDLFCPYVLAAKKYLVVLHPFDIVYKPNKGNAAVFEPRFDFYDSIKPHHLKNFDGHCITDPSIFTYMINQFKNDFDRGFKGILFEPRISSFPTKDLNTSDISIMACGFNSAPPRNSQRYHDFYINLESKNILNAYGPSDSWFFLKKGAWKGVLSFSIDDFSVINQIQKHGICLVTHSSYHLESGVPSCRIFESAAAGALCISDKHPFVIENFGDSVLYFDHTASAKEMSRQVEEHVRWARNNPEEAQLKANQARKIFDERLSLRPQVLKILALHEKISLQ